MNKTYDFIVIGSGISACTFASCLNKRFSDTSILLVEHGRRLGGRATTRKSRKYTTLEFDHGLPSLSFSQDVSEDIQTLLSPLINSKKLLDISKDILKINEFSEMDNASTKDKIYRGWPFMINFCEEIINQSINPKKIDFLFQTLTKSMKRRNNEWEVSVNQERIITSKNLILSSSLIAHPRCLEILKISSLPIRDAFIPGEDKVVDALLKKISKQKYIKRTVYILYVPKSEAVKNFNNNYLQILFSKVIREDLNFEKIIFQRQLNRSMIIALHCSYTKNFLDLSKNNIIKTLTTIFVNYQIFLDLFLQAILIDKMEWRASQPLNHLVPRELQWSSISNIGFCGDWFDFDSYRGAESAMNSSIRLAKILKFN